MNNVGVAALVLGAVAVGFGAATYGKRPETRPIASGEAPSRPLEAPRLPAVPTSIPPAVERHVPASAPASNEPGAPKPQATAAEPEPPTEEERRVYASSVFDSQTFDAGWAPAAANELRTALGTVSLPGVRVRDVQCRSTLCRVELYGDDETSVEKSLKTYVRAAKWRGSGMAVRDEPDARGALTVTLYFTRGDGVPLPEPPADAP